VADKLKARRVRPAVSPLVLVLSGVIVVLLVLVAVVLANSPLFREPTALDLARDELLVALADSPGNPELLMSLAEVEYEMGRRGDAFRHAEDALAGGSERATINMRYAMLLIRDDRADEARPLLEAEVALDATNAEAHFLLGQVLREEGDLSGALSSLEEALRLNPINGDYRLAYADTLALAGRIDEAIAGYASVLAVLPGDERAIAGLEALGVDYEPAETVDPHASDD
jgi:tetratricopeptide (TPR) repeat protein